MHVQGSKYYLSHVPALTLGVPTSHFLPRSLPAHTELVTRGVLAFVSVFAVVAGVAAAVDDVEAAFRFEFEFTLFCDTVAFGRVVVLGLEFTLSLDVVDFGGQLTSGTSSGQARSRSNGTLMEGSFGLSTKVTSAPPSYSWMIR